LPVFDRDYIATVSRFLDTGSLGNTGVTIVVNGMEVNGLNVSASAISQVRINQDPYSAEYSRPGRGRIEILTKPGSQSYHGEVNAIVRDARFNSQNAFASAKPPEQRHIFEGFLGGPLGKSGKTSFMLSANDERGDFVSAPRAAGHLHAADDPAADARESVSDALRARARTDNQPDAGSRHCRRRRVYRRRRPGRSHAHRDAHQHEREPRVDPRS